MLAHIPSKVGILEQLLHVVIIDTFTASETPGNYSYLTFLIEYLLRLSMDN